MAGTRNLSPGMRLAVRVGKGGEPGWSQMARQLAKAGYSPSWGRSKDPGVSDGTLRDLYSKPRPGRLNAQSRAAHRKEIDKFVASHRLNRRKLEPIKEQEVPRGRKVYAVSTSPADAIHRPSVYVGTFDLTAAKAPQLNQSQVIRTIVEAYAQFPGAGNTEAHLYNVRICVEVDAAAVAGTYWDRYVQFVMKNEPEAVTRRGGHVFVRITLSQNVTRSDIDASARKASAGGRGQWAQRFIEEVFGVRPKRVLGFGVAPIDWQAP